MPRGNISLYVLSFFAGDFAISNGARLGNRTEATILILPSDDPSGILEFASNSLEVSVAEDYRQGYMNATIANLTIERKMGSFGSIQVLFLNISKS